MEDPRANGERSHDNNNNHLSKKQKLSSKFISDSEIHQEFAHHQLGISRINNGSFGSCPASIIAAQKRWQLRFLQQPDDFFFNHLQKGILRSRTLIKSLINADHVDEVSIVDNATTAAAIVLQHVGWAFAEGRFEKGDAVVMLHCAFQAVKKSIEAYVTRAGGSVIVVQLPFPVHSEQEIIAEFRKGLAKGKAHGRKVRLAIIDHITSMPCVVIPVRELVQICREEGVEKVFVDAAHAIGSVHVDVKQIGADFYVSNLHKWFFCPPSVAFLYCRKSSPDPDLHHPVVSHEYGNGLAIESAWIGTRDYSSQLVVPEVLDFISRFEGGIVGIRDRNHEAVVKMGEMLANAWETHLGSPPHMCPSMAMVGLPSSLRVLSDEDASRLRTHLRNRFGVEVPIHYQAPKDGNDSDRVTGYVRISHQVYNTVDDYLRLRDAINLLLEEGVTCQSLHKDK
ncbi:OLC1v1028140C1 [Oldenlandia corymbosa var. corymbosa]|uniref:OLC1v1028140C1 n=1 Tax=Oldenlandia corymbosa var. corymbosa TaxID=529605 RepID=A0AAV1CB26_OLDCO|nr:OLC1v1028140C1 [Oldenlandia corymbosa var. corymbosa]